MRTSKPASARTIAEVLPPAPEPTTIALPGTASPRDDPERRGLDVRHDARDERIRNDGIQSVRLSDLTRGVPARLRVAVERDLVPSDPVLVPAIFGRRKEPFDRVCEKDRQEV